MSNPFVELIELKKQEQSLAIAIKTKQEEALNWHFSGDETKKLTGKIAEIDGASINIKFVKKKPEPTPEIKAELQRANEIEEALKIANKKAIEALEAQIAELVSNEESKAARLHADTLLKQIDGEMTAQIAVTLPKQS